MSVKQGVCFVPKYKPFMCKECRLAKKERMAEVEADGGGVEEEIEHAVATIVALGIVQDLRDGMYEHNRTNEQY